MTIVQSDLILDDAIRYMLDLQFSRDEIKKAMWSISDGKAPGLDGYNSMFYKEA